MSSMGLEPMHRNDHNLHRVCIDFDATRCRIRCRLNDADFRRFCYFSASAEERCRNLHQRDADAICIVLHQICIGSRASGVENSWTPSMSLPHWQYQASFARQAASTSCSSSHCLCSGSLPARKHPHGDLLQRKAPATAPM